MIPPFTQRRGSVGQSGPPLVPGASVRGGSSGVKPADIVDIPRDSAYCFSGATPFTVSFWYRRQAAPSSLANWGPQNSPNSNQIYTNWDYGFMCNSLSHIFFVRQSAGVVSQATYNVSVTNGTWYFVAGIFDGTKSTLYWNATLSASGAVITGVSNQATSHIEMFRTSYVSVRFQHDIDNLRIDNSALSGADLTSLYNKTNPATTATRLWKFNFSGAETIAGTPTASLGANCSYQTPVPGLPGES